MGSIYDDFASLSAQTQYEDCDVNFWVGSPLSLREEPAPGIDETAPRLWYRITLLEVIEKQTATIRVERLQAASEPNSSESCF